MIKFRQKDFSILSSTIGGAGIGGSLGSAVTIFRPRKEKEDESEIDKKKAEKKYNLTLKLGGMLVGAALGALYGTVKEISKRVNRNKTVDARLMEKVLQGLKASNFKEGVDFTRDPKQATQMRTKVCIVISKFSGELKLLINVAKDKTLEQITTQIVKNIPNTSNVITRTGDRYNDIIVSTISDNSADPGLICGLVEKFIHNKYPVYLVEVG